MAAQLNKVLLIGNLTRDPELRYTPSGVPVANIGIAINKSIVTQSGEKREIVSFLRIVAWRKLAEFCGNYLKKGRLIFVEGSLQSRSWTSPDGVKKNSVEVIADNIQTLDRPEGTQVQEDGGATAQSAEENAPASEEEGQKDDLPF